MFIRKERYAIPALSATSAIRFAVLAATLTVSACGGGGSTDTSVNQTEPDEQTPNDPPSGPITTGGEVIDVSDPLQCNLATQKQWAYDSMQDFYLFYDQVPVVDPQTFESADDLVRNVRFQERDEFSYVSNATESALVAEEGREFGLGYGWKHDTEDNPRIADVITDSPMGRAGIERGDIIVSVDGMPWEQVLGPDFVARIFGTSENPATTRWKFMKRDTSQIVDVAMTATEYSINTIITSTVYSNPNRPGVNVGYLVFNEFLETSRQELDRQFNIFQNENISELILDMRYNRGGRIVIAEHLASLIAGDSQAGQLMYEYRFNDKYPDSKETLSFLNNVGDLGLARVIILTSSITASSSEIVIAGLQPYMEVVTIGETTTGKPYVSYTHDRCDERLNVIEAEGFNAAGNSVYGGIPASCYAEDDLTRNFGLNATQGFEGQLLAGISYIEEGSCASAPIFSSARQSMKSTPWTADTGYREAKSDDNGAWAD